MLSRKNVYAIINQLILTLNTYLAKHPYMILTKAQLNAGYKCLVWSEEQRQNVDGLRRYSYSTLCEDGKYIAFESELSNRNSMLTLHRMKNIYNLRQALSNHFSAIQEEKEDAFNQRLDKIRELIEKGIIHNKQLSIEYSVRHLTYEDGRLAGHGIFASWCNKTWTKSRAGCVLEKSLTLLDKFRNKFVSEATPIKATPIPSAPPAYVSLDVPDQGYTKTAKQL